MNFIFSQSLSKQNISQLVGISVECNRLDLLERSLRCSSDLSSSLYHLLSLLQDFDYPESVRNKLLQLICSLFQELGDRYGVFRCLLHLYNLQGSECLIRIQLLVASLLIDSYTNAPTVAYQIAFDLAGLGDEGLITALLPLLPSDSSFDRLRDILRGVVTRQL